MRKLLSLILLLLTAVTFAQTISVQGVLRDAKGLTVVDGDYQVTFNLYDQPTGGAILYTETHPSVTTSQGLFAARLGAVGDSLPQLPFDTTYYLGISIEGKAELEPRTELTLSPYAKGVRGRDNQFPSTGNVNVRSDFTIDLGNVYLQAGDAVLEKGNLTLDSGTFLINLGDIQLTDAGGAIRFPDGTILNSAEGGTAAAAGNADTLSVTADADLDSTGGIEFQIGVQPAMTIRNDGLVTLENGLVLDSGKIMYEGNRDITLGHYTASDSSFTTQVTMGYDSTVTFARIPQSLDTAVADDDAFTLGYLKGVMGESLTQPTGRQLEVGDSYNGGTIFAVRDGYAYIAHEYATSTYRFYAYGSSGGSAFGTGYDNTQNLLSNASSTDYIEGILRSTINGYHDWFIPSRHELEAVFDSTNVASQSGYYWTSTLYASGDYVILSPGGASSWEDYHDNEYLMLIRREVVRNNLNYDTSDPNDYVTAGVLQNNRSSFTENEYQLGEEIGAGNDRGTVFARTADSVYIAKYVSAYRVLTNTTGFSWQSSQAFGSGYTNTQNMIEAINNYYGSLSSNEWGYRIENDHPNWYLPSVDELKAVLDSIPRSIVPGAMDLWTSNSTRSSYSDYRGIKIETNSIGGYSSISEVDRDYGARAVLIRSVPKQDRNLYSSTSSNLVTWDYFNGKMAALEAKMAQAEAALVNSIPQGTNPYDIGTQTEGGTVFAVEGGYAYIAYDYGHSRFQDYISSASGTAFGTGYDNTQAILSATSTTSTDYIEGILRSTVNGYNDWFLPSQDELQAVFNNTPVASYSSPYYWSSTYYGCCGDYVTVSPYGNSNDDYHDYYNGLIIVRRVPLN